MYTINIFLLGASQISLQYRKADTGLSVMALLNRAFAENGVKPDIVVNLNDDYGRQGSIRLDQIAAYFGAAVEIATQGVLDANMVQSRVQQETQEAIHAEAARHATELAAQNDAA